MPTPPELVPELERFFTLYWTLRRDEDWRRRICGIFAGIAFMIMLLAMGGFLWVITP